MVCGFALRVIWFRLFSVVVIEENGVETKTVVLSHWVDEKQLIFYYPPKGPKVLAAYLAEWAAPQVGWREFVVIEHILKAATLDICNQMLSFSTEEDSESSDTDGCRSIAFFLHFLVFIFIVVGTCEYGLNLLVYGVILYKPI